MNEEPTSGGILARLTSGNVVDGTFPRTVAGLWQRVVADSAINGFVSTVEAQRRWPLAAGLAAVVVLAGAGARLASGSHGKIGRLADMEIPVRTKAHQVKPWGPTRRTCALGSKETTGPGAGFSFLTFWVCSRKRFR